MRNRIGMALASVLALGLIAGVATAAPKSRAPHAAAASASKPAKSGRSKYALRQFTGVVTAFDKESITVEKAGKQPMTRTFARDEKTLTSGDVAKEAKVTVFYREENGKAIAHRVVVKPDAT